MKDNPGNKASLFFLLLNQNQGFETFLFREISTGSGAIRQQLADLDLRILIENSLVEWKELVDKELAGNEYEWEDQKMNRRKSSLRTSWVSIHYLKNGLLRRSNDLHQSDLTRFVVHVSCAWFIVSATICLLGDGRWR